MSLGPWASEHPGHFVFGLRTEVTRRRVCNDVRVLVQRKRPTGETTNATPERGATTQGVAGWNDMREKTLGGRIGTHTGGLDDEGRRYSSMKYS